MTVVIQSVSDWLPQTQTWMYNQAKHLPADIESHIFCKKTMNLDQFYLPNIHSHTDATLGSYYLDKSLRKLRIRRHWGFLVETSKKHGAQLVHSHFGNVGWTDIGAVKQIGTRHIVTFYGLDVNMMHTQDKRWVKRYKKLFKSADLFLCEGPHMAKCIMGLGCPQEKIKVHHLGVDVNNIPFRPRRWQPGEPLRMLIAATFKEKKGIPYALEAARQLQKKVDIEITIIGDSTPEARSRKEKEHILKVIEKYNMQSVVNMPGFQHYSVLMEQAYKHHIFLSPSITAKDGDTEGGAPVTIIEMIASGMPVVSTRHCDIPEVIKDRVTGLLAEERDVTGLVSCLCQLLEQNNAWQYMLCAGREKVDKEFNVYMQAKRLGAFYKRLVER